MATRAFDPYATISGHVWLYEGKRRKTWCAKWRDQHGQHEKRLGPAWTSKGPPAPGFLRERDAQALLDAILVDARRGQLQHERTGLTFKEVAEEWYERGCFERDWSASTRADYRSILDAHLLSEFGPKPPEAITTQEIESWRDRLAEEELPESRANKDVHPDGDDQPRPTRSRRTVNKIVTQLHSILQYAVKRHGLASNPAAEVDRLQESYAAARFDFYSPEEIHKLTAAAANSAHRNPKRPARSDTERVLRAAEDRQDAAIYLTAALSGLRRSELLALRWEDVDFEQSSIRVFEGYSAKRAGKPKSRKSRTVPMVDEIAEALRALKTRDAHTDQGGLVFVSREGTPVDGSALRRRYIATLNAAGLRQLTFHDLRHTFGSLAINVASIVQVQAWMGHADIKTTMRYLHHKSRADDAQLLSAAFRPTMRESAVR
ncbi:MAG TPA: tyrosine-type recombinase/integrase [Solirubrobacteraceae bacterium]|jgi:integrase|nr:tyrosine-type recombinase/integrase [Solirubrobacteraceae bacterium]